MAILSVGYDGAVTESQWSDMIKKIGSAEYGVVGQNDWEVSAVAGADRTISIAPGKGWGHGVFDENTAPVQIQLDPVTSGSRYDLIVMRRDWTGIGGSSTFAKVTGTSAATIPVTRQKGPGVIDEQPIALVQVNAGQTAPGIIRDLRCWSGNGGLAIRHDLCLSYLDAVGTEVLDMGNGKRYRRVIGQDGNLFWSAGVEDGYAPLYGIGPSINGGIPAVYTEAGIAKAPNFLIQAGSTVQQTDAAGYGRITWPKQFPNGLLTVILTNGDSSATGGAILEAEGNNAFWGPSGNGGRTDVVYMLRDFLGTQQMARSRWVRVNWIAIGW
jgi:hypothetical protein